MLLRYVPILLLSSFIIRILILGASLADSLVVLSLSAVYGFYLHLDSKKEVIPNKEIKDRIVTLEEQLKETKSNVTALKLGTQLRGK